MQMLLKCCLVARNALLRKALRLKSSTFERVCKAVAEDRVHVSEHAYDEAFEDNLSVVDVIDETPNGDVIEDYPNDPRSPSCLVLLTADGGNPVTAGLSKCARCGSTDLEDKDIEKLVRVGDDVAALRVRATICHHCGERYLSSEAIRALDLARRDLEAGEVTRFRALGRFLTLQPDNAG